MDPSNYVSARLQMPGKSIIKKFMETPRAGDKVECDDSVWTVTQVTWREEPSGYQDTPPVWRPTLILEFLI